MKILLAGAASGPAGGIAASRLRRNINVFARTFIAGETPREGMKALKRVLSEGRAFTVDILGQAAVSEKEAHGYLGRYLDLIETLSSEAAGWWSADPERERFFPRLNISVKLSSLYSRIGSMNYEDSVKGVKERLRPVLRAARRAEGFVNLDMEMYDLKNITIDVFTELLEEPEFTDWSIFGIALQAYMKESGRAGRCFVPRRGNRPRPQAGTYVPADLRSSEKLDRSGCRRVRGDRLSGILRP
jgi:RHH-type proline utilization regulon transcriptional repressor/proline dehydrogenase/delta 1-pyrroline-5-carboxylate dehydrogenase